MKLDQRSSWNRHHGGRPPPAGPDRWGLIGSTAARTSSVLSADPTSRTATEEVGLTLAPPPHYRSLLVPVDGSPFGEHALPLALGIARRAGAEVRVVYVHSPLESSFQPDRLYPDSGLDAWLRRRQKAYLDGLVRRIADVSPVPVTPLLLERRGIADSLCEAAAVGTDLVVMATHGRGPLGRLWHGSVANALRQRLSVPLLLVQGDNWPADLASDPVVRHILIPLDGSAFAEQVLDPALALGALEGAEHTVLRVIPLETDGPVGFSGGMQRSPRARAQAEARTYVQRVAGRLAEPAHRIHPRTVLDERPTAEAILDYARVHHADLIALATRGRGGLGRLVQGSVADRVVQGASVPVLVFRPDGDEESRRTR